MTLGTATTVRRGPNAQGVSPLRMVAAAAAHLHDWAARGDGRRRTGRVLRSLDRDTWQISQHIQLPDGGYADHLAIGASGVYVLDSRAWHGAVTVDHKGATITPEGQPAAAWTARGQHCSLAPAAARLGRVLSTAAGRPLPTPRAVVVIWASFPDRLAVSAGITYVAGEHLAEWLSGESRRADQHARISWAGDLQDPLRSRSLA